MARTSAIKKKLEEIDGYRYNPRQIDNIINRIENIPERNISKFEKNFIDLERENKRLKEMDSLKNTGLDCDRKYNELASFKKSDTSCFREKTDANVFALLVQ